MAGVLSSRRGSNDRRDHGGPSIRGTARHRFLILEFRREFENIVAKGIVSIRSSACAAGGRVNACVNAVWRSCEAALDKCRRVRDTCAEKSLNVFFPGCVVRDT